MKYDTPESRMLDVVKDRFGIGNDKLFAERLKISSQNLCHIRAGRLKLGARYQLNILELTGWTVAQMRKAMEAPCKETLTR